jgi:CRP-like cAMP-binding protein
MHCTALPARPARPCAALHALICATPRPAMRAQVVITEGEEGDSFFIVEEGTAECFKTGTEGPVAVLGSGAYFGEVRLLLTAPPAAFKCIHEWSTTRYRELNIAPACVSLHRSSLLAYGLLLLRLRCWRTSLAKPLCGPPQAGFRASPWIV